MKWAWALTPLFIMLVVAAGISSAFDDGDRDDKTEAAAARTPDKDLVDKTPAEEATEIPGTPTPDPTMVAAYVAAVVKAEAQATTEQAYVEALATYQARPTTTPTPCPIPEVRGGEVHFCSDRHAEIFMFWMGVNQVVSPSDANHSVFQDASDFARRGQPNLYDYYTLVVRVGELHHAAADAMQDVPAPEGLYEARDEISYGLRNRGDAMGHLANFINTSDLEELRKAEQDYAEADYSVYWGMLLIAQAAQEAGLDPVWLLESVECSNETQTCGLAQH